VGVRITVTAEFHGVVEHLPQRTAAVSSAPHGKPHGQSHGQEVLRSTQRSAVVGERCMCAAVRQHYAPMAHCEYSNTPATAVRQHCADGPL
jgi:hypothetical protein